MDQKGCVIKCPLGTKAKKSRTNAQPVGLSSQDLTNFSVIESQSALSNAEDLNNALMDNRNVNHEPANPNALTHSKDLTSDAELGQDYLGDHHDDPFHNSDQSQLLPLSPTNTNEPGTPRVNMSFGE
ncbi:uncharacterized protein MELLADRAFT_60358 [Melampsora larici-populina 98AG31]|uniref:Uncharacterized protein n=1 Tax=Melampsora larici-populina (strain 98AG31 / pathotype 3-4-7) TaxID=747676 RepID=F4R9T6_MELLP|nr:uncharacterized protein MELLADRAFT_60358 [Melampsora larici-populina 98AG31]EGG10579.1 hypothetical protein MELLADRAFT_60358 [Melampsora larici-populina 98AG31]